MTYIRSQQKLFLMLAASPLLSFIVLNRLVVTELGIKSFCRV
jgi:hypothetical protein